MPFTLKDASGQDVSVPTSEEIAEMITGATRAQIEKANKKLAADLTTSLGSSLAETLNQYEAKRAELETEKTKTAPKPGEADPGIESHPKFKGLEKQLADLAKKAELAETREKEAHAK